MTAAYDYVIVGAGSAGCVLAARLTEDPEVRVALIEAGGPDTDQEIHVPAAFSQQFKTRLDWDFDTDPEPGPRSLRPDAAPRIVHNYLATAADRAVLAAGVRICLEIAAQPAMRAVITGPFGIPPSGASDAELLEWAAGVSGTLYHPTSTCAIGSVVDTSLRVFGIDRLRVVDASVFPSVIRGNTNAPVIMVAEKAADLIKGASQ